MKVVLRQDVQKLGRKGDIKEVSDGFARNCLIPEGKCEPATPAAIKRATEKTSREAATKEASTEALNVCAQKLSETTLEFKRAANEDGTLFAAVSAEEVLVAINEVCGGEFDAKNLTIGEAIKQVGDHTITFNGAKAKVSVQAE